MLSVGGVGQSDTYYPRPGLTRHGWVGCVEKIARVVCRPHHHLSVRSSEEDIVKALDNGANDYLTKAFRTRELMARIRVATHQVIRQQEASMVFDKPDNRSVQTRCHKNNEIIKLTTTEFALLALMAKNEGRVLTHVYILQEIWGYGYTEQTQYLRVFVATTAVKR